MTHDPTNVNERTAETHQQAGPGEPVLTTRQGLPVADDQNTLRMGARGPALLEQLRSAATAEEALVELVAPRVGGATSSTGALTEADQKIGGGPSVLYDAVVLLPGAKSVPLLADDAAVRDFVADAYAHCKFIGYVAAAEPLLAAAGVQSKVDRGFVALDEDGADAFVERCRELRLWERELLVTTGRR